MAEELLCALQRPLLPDLRRLSVSPNSCPERHDLLPSASSAEAKLYWAFPNPMLERDIRALWEPHLLDS